VDALYWVAAICLAAAAIFMRIIILNLREATDECVPRQRLPMRSPRAYPKPEAFVPMVLLVVLGLLLPASPAEAAQLPDRMTAIGDSISQATDVCCWYGDHPGSSWSTGGRFWDGVRSHYERLLEINPDINRNNHNASRAGARMAEAPAQAAGAVQHQADYVTILMGANDACTSSSSTMTPVEDFQAQFNATIQTLQSELPEARIFVASIPNVYHLWQIYKDSSIARFVWKTARICQSMLAASNTEEDRQAVLTRIREFNDVLAAACGLYPRCRFDDYAVFNYPFERKHVSKLDFFHPSLSGQSVLASITWAKSWWSATAD
jgi:lysophospholipase L1-like esterase